jgi:hypothetical protein
MWRVVGLALCRGVPGAARAWREVAVRGSEYALGVVRRPSRWLPALVVALGLAVACSGSRQEATDGALPALDGHFEPLRAAFDADADHVRLLAILSPT